MSLKRILWKRVQQKRDGWERKYNILFRKVLNKEFKKLAERIDVTNMGSESVLQVMGKEGLEKTFIELYRNVGVAFAKDTFKGLKSDGMFLTKTDDDLEDTWRTYMTQYAKITAGKKIVSITGENKRIAVKIIRAVMDLSTENGWGADETARQIRKALLTEGQDLNKWRALRIARTEIVSASNQGAQQGAKSLDMPMEKFWLPTFDQRTRDTHLVIEQQNPIDIDDYFKVGNYMMQMPGDENGGAEEVINCRCAVAYKVKT